MPARYLKFLLLACAMAPAIVQASENNPFIPSGFATPEIEQRLILLEQRAKEAERLLGELTMEQLPGVDAGLLNGAAAAAASTGAAVSGEIEVIGRINGKCLIKRGGAGQGARLEEAPGGFECVPGTRVNDTPAN